MIADDEIWAAIKVKIRNLWLDSQAEAPLQPSRELSTASLIECDW